MPTPAPALSAPHIVLTVQLSAPDMDALLDAISQFSATMDDPDRIAAIRVDENASAPNWTWPRGLSIRAACTLTGGAIMPQVSAPPDSETC